MSDEIDYQKLAREVASEMDPSKVASEMDTGKVADDRWMLSRRQLAAVAGSGLGAGALASLGIGDAEAGSSQVGTIGASGSEVDVVAEDVEVSDTVTTQNLTVNGTATGVGGGINISSGDSVTLVGVSKLNTSGNSNFTVLNQSPAVDVYGGVIAGAVPGGLKVTFGDGSSFDATTTSDLIGNDGAADSFGTTNIPAMQNVSQIEGFNSSGTQRTYGAQIFIDK